MVLSVILLVLCGCSKLEKATPIIENISCTAEIEYNHSKYVCDLESFKDGLNLTVVEPKEIAGIKFIIKNNKVTTEYKGISDAPELNELPQHLITRIVFDVINDVKGKEIEFDKFNGVINEEVEGYKYGFVFSPAGLPISLSIEDIDLEIYFKDISLK